MNTITEMRAEIIQLQKGMNDITAQCELEKREPDEGEIKYIEDALVRLAQLRKLIELREAMDVEHDALEQSATPPVQPVVTDDGDQNRAIVPDGRIQVQPPNAVKDQFRGFGDFITAVIQAGSPGGRTDPRLMQHRATGLGELVPSEGGFLVGTDTTDEILKRAYETGQVASKCRKFTVGANANGLKINAIDETSRATGSRWGGVQGYWLAEAGTKLATKPKFRQIELTLKKLIGLCYLTDELLQDVTAMESIVRQAFAEEIAFLLDDAVINGPGAGTPLGIMNSASLITVAKETSQAAKTVVPRNIWNMYARLWVRSRSSAVWFINQDVEPSLNAMALQDAQTSPAWGVPVYLPPGGMSAAPYGTLLGRPVIPIEQCQTLGTAGDIILADMSQYVMIDKGAMQQASSIHVRFIYDESCIRFVYRCDGQPAWNAALTPYKGTNTVSPFIDLIVRS